MTNVTIITKDNISTIISDGVTLIKFGATWCGPCRQMAPIVEQLSNDFNENSNVSIGDCDIDNDQELAMQYGIRSVPTTIIFKDGEVVDNIIGVETATNLTNKINSHF
jgi:thioredoxin 1